MKKIQEFDESQLRNNPFAQALSIPVTEIVKNDTVKLNEDGIWLNGVMYAEKTQKVEIYYLSELWGKCSRFIR